MVLTTVDIETTGFDKDFNDIIQFAYLQTTSDGKLIKQETLYFYYPGVEKSWSADAESVHGISLESLKKYADDFETNCKKMWIIMFKSNCVTYNGDRFDIPFIHRWLTRQGYPVNNVTDVPVRSYDVYKLRGMRCKLVEAPGKLGINPAVIKAVTEAWFGPEDARAHAAHYDVVATWLCLSALKNKGWVTLEDKETSTVTEEHSLVDNIVSEKKAVIGNITYYLQTKDNECLSVVLCDNVPDTDIFIKPAVCSNPSLLFKQASDKEYINGNLCITVDAHNIQLGVKR